MAQLVIRNIPDFDGEYEVPQIGTMTGDDFHLIKVFAQVRAGQIEEAAGEGDYDLFCALAAIALARAHKIPSGDTLAAAGRLRSGPVGTITAILDEEESGGADPPPKTNESGANAPSSSSNISSQSSNGSSEPSPGMIPDGIGDRS